jgi:hypothetical protein
LRDSYVRPPHPLTLALKEGLSERELKRLRAARRRIHAHFGGRDAIRSLAVTIGARNATGSVLCGFFLRAAGGHGVEGIQATEGYAWPVQNSTDPGLCVTRAIAEVYLLGFEDVPLEAFVLPADSLELSKQLLARSSPSDGDTHAGLYRLLHGLRRIVVQPCVKGPFFVAMTRKLEVLDRRWNNECTVVDFAEVERKLMQRLVP